MRIAFIGSHGVGKTTIAAPISQALGLPFIAERARTVASSWGVAPADVSNDRFTEYQWQVISEQVEAESRHRKGFVSDRSVIDNMAYWMSRVEDLEIPWSQTERYKQMAAERLPLYDLLVYVPIMFPLPTDDPERHPELAYQAEINALVLALLSENAAKINAEVYHVLTDGPENRIDEVLGVVSRMRALR